MRKVGCRPINSGNVFHAVGVSRLCAVNVDIKYGERLVQGVTLQAVQHLAVLDIRFVGVGGLHCQMGSQSGNLAHMERIGLAQIRIAAVSEEGLVKGCVSVEIGLAVPFARASSIASTVLATDATSARRASK